MTKRLLIFLCLIPVMTMVRAEDFKLRHITTTQGIPWGMTFVADNKILFTERAGKVAILDIKNGQFNYLPGLPEVFVKGQGGLLDVVVEPNYQKGGWIYFSYVKKLMGRGVTTLARARLHNNKLEDWTDLLVTQSATDTGRHFGSRIVFDDDGYLYFSVGDRGKRPNGQNLKTHAGSILRIKPDGRVPADNPFVDRQGVLPEIWSYGHRNPQGLAWDGENKRLWAIEHGPRGGDEINLIEKGKNYGWPVISYGKEYWGPVAVGEGTQREGMEQPVKYYVPSIAPGSLLYYQGEAFPRWKGRLLAGALKLLHINLVTLDQWGRAVQEERILEDLNERIRALLVSPAGLIYFSTDSGKIFEMSPQNEPS